MNEGEGHIYHFLGRREKRTQSSISNKFIIPELPGRLNESELDPRNLTVRQEAGCGLTRASIPHTLETSEEDRGHRSRKAS